MKKIKGKVIFFVLLSSFLFLGGLIFILIEKNYLFAESNQVNRVASERQMNIEDYDISEFFYFKQVGKTSWYGKKFHRRKTASGEIFDMNKMTAAHRWLPFGTIVRVRNLENGQVVLVKINDRGPFVYSKILDLSYHSAKMLDGLGNSQVELEALIPQESEDIDLTEPYFFGYSYEYPLVCLPASKIEILEEFNDFDSTLKFYNDILEKHNEEFLYVFVPASQTYKNIKYLPQEKYFVGRFLKGGQLQKQFFVQEQKQR